MRFLSLRLLLVSALISISSAFLVPIDIIDGMYVHIYHPNNTHTHTPLAIALSAHTVTRSLPPAKFARDLPLPFTTINCGNRDGIRYHLIESNVVAAIKQFTKNCHSDWDLGGDGHDLYSVYGDTIVFMCNYGGRWCKTDEFDMSFDLILDECGDHSGLNNGWVMISSWQKSYGFDSADSHICR